MKALKTGVLLFLTIFIIGCDTNSGGLPQGPINDGNAATGKTLYAAHCSGCHGNEGKGDGPGSQNINPKPANHTDPQFMGSIPDSTLFLVVRKGGSVAGKPTMPPFPNLTDNEIKDLIAFMRSISKP